MGLWMQGLIDRVYARIDSDNDFYWEKGPTPILDMVDNPIRLKNLSLKVSCSKLVIIFIVFIAFASFLVTNYDLRSISFPKYLSLQELKQLAGEIRSDLSFIMSGTQISPKASMAVVELTVAIHHVFHAPVDKILWDVGDQVRFYVISKNASAPFLF